MYLSPTEEDRLRVFVAAELARRVLASGRKLNAPEAVALACDAMHLAARAGGSYAAVVAAGRGAVEPEQILGGVADLVPEIRLEVLLEEGSRLVVLRDPFRATAGLAAPGVGAVAGSSAIGTVRSPDATMPKLGAGGPTTVTVTMTVTNRSTRPVRVSSHFPFWQANPRLEFDRQAARGRRLALPSGASVRWAPGERREVELIAYEPTGDAGAAE